MNYQVGRQYTDQTIRIPIRTWDAARVVIKVNHYSKPNTSYFDTAPIINGFETFIVKIPNMPESVIIELYNEANGNLDADNTLAVGSISVMPIKLGWQISKIMNPTVSSFARFSDIFAEDAAIISAQNSIYLSECGRFRIDYKDVIRNDEGDVLRTPARINSKTKIIEISKKHYLGYTVPGRKAINWHEFSHMFINKDRKNEMEADKNAIMLYLGTGNPTIEAYNVFLKVFKNSPSDLNKARYNEINKYIKELSYRINSNQISMNSQRNN